MFRAAGLREGRQLAGLSSIRNFLEINRTQRFHFLFLRRKEMKTDYYIFKNKDDDVKSALRRKRGNTSVDENTSHRL